MISQLVAAATSVGANYVEADDAVSKKEFLKSIGTCRKEARETKHFLRMIVRAVPELKPQARELWIEAKELHLIFSRIWRGRKMNSKTKMVEEPNNRATLASSFELRHSFVLRHSDFVILIMPADSTMIEVDRLVRKFGDRTVLNDISFNVHRGDTLVIMGGSGCGKSTLLRHMIGSMQPTSGTVKLFGEEVTGMKEREILRIRLRFGMLFQSGALLASLTVGENVALPLLQHTNKSVDEIEEIVEQKLQMVGLTGFEDLRPDEISGGMKKRVGLARALALDPELLFSDEPTSGLDPIMTAVVDELTMKLTRGKGMTAVVVSHDMTSAFRIATRMIMLGHGGIVAQGTPDEIRASSNPEVQQFINGEPDGPIPLNLSQEEHEHHQHVKPRPFARARRRFHRKTG